MKMNEPAIDAYIKRHELFLVQVVDRTVVPASRILEALRYTLLSGGKRIRPLLIYLGGELLDINLAILDVIAAAVEITHCYSLVHDDLPAMDNDDVRRGRPSCHKAFDEATAILVGDGMQILAIEALLTGLAPLLPPTKIVTIVQKLVKAAGISGMVSGQSLDLSELSDPGLKEEKLKQIHQLKTGVLFTACFEMIIAAADKIPEEHSQALRHYAQHLGLAFQMQDDYLDYYAPATFLGKNRASDKENQKSTFATLVNQSQLEARIDSEYQKALASLEVFAHEAQPLREFTACLHRRSLAGATEKMY